MWFKHHKVLFLAHASYLIWVSGKVGFMSFHPGIQSAGTSISPALLAAQVEEQHPGGTVPLVKFSSLRETPSFPLTSLETESRGHTNNFGVWGSRIPPCLEGRIPECKWTILLLRLGSSPRRYDLGISPHNSFLKFSEENVIVRKEEMEPISLIDDSFSD